MAILFASSQERGDAENWLSKLKHRTWTIRLDLMCFNNSKRRCITKCSHRFNKLHNVSFWMNQIWTEWWIDIKLLEDIAPQLSSVWNFKKKLNHWRYGSEQWGKWKRLWLFRWGTFKFFAHFFMIELLIQFFPRSKTLIQRQTKAEKEGNELKPWHENDRKLEFIPFD